MRILIKSLSQVTSIQSTFQTFDRSVKVQTKQDKAPEGSTRCDVTMTWYKTNILFLLFASDASEEEAESKERAIATTAVATAAEVAVTNGGADHDDLPQIDPSTVAIVEDGEVKVELVQRVDWGVSL